MIDLAAYFARLGFPRGEGPRAPTLAAIDALHRAHVQAIPFENLDVLLARGVSLDLDAVEDKLVRRRRGGYCFEHVTLFSAVLAALGVRHRALGARVLAGATVAIPPRTHALLEIELEGRLFLGDPGFGGLGPRGLLPWVEDAPLRTGDLSHRLLRRGDEWLLQNEHEGGFVDTHRFGLDTFHPIDLEVANHYTATHPRSRFKSLLMVQRHREDGRVSLRDRELTVRAGEEVTRTTLATDAAVHRALFDHFGIDVPVEDVRVP